MLNSARCRAVRLRTIRSGKWDFTRGLVKDRKVEITLERCGIPLFSDAEQRLGICNACFVGWRTNGNQLVTTDINAEICPTCNGKSVDLANRIICVKCECRGFILGG